MPCKPRHTKSLPTFDCRCGTWRPWPAATSVSAAHGTAATQKKGMLGCRGADLGDPSVATDGSPSTCQKHPMSGGQRRRGDCPSAVPVADARGIDQQASLSRERPAVTHRPRRSQPMCRNVRTERSNRFADGQAPSPLHGVEAAPGCMRGLTTYRRGCANESADRAADVGRLPRLLGRSR